MNRFELDAVRVMERIRCVEVVRTESQQADSPWTWPLRLALPLLVGFQFPRNLLQLTPDPIVEERSQEIRVSSRTWTRRPTHGEMNVERLRGIE